MPGRLPRAARLVPQSVAGDDARAPLSPDAPAAAAATAAAAAAAAAAMDADPAPPPPQAALDAAAAAAAVAAAAAAPPPPPAPPAGLPLPSAAASASAANDVVEAAAALLLAPYRAYGRALEERPLLTKALTSFVGFMLGDAIAQAAAHHGAPPGLWQLDAARVLRLGLYGLCVDGPLGAAWYDWLEAHVAPEDPRGTRAVLTKTALDQVVYASFGTVLFFTVVTLLEGRPSAVPAVVAAKFLPTLAANYAIWPAAHLINFRFVPAPYRIFYNNVVAIGWLALLSAITHSKGGGLAAALLARLQALLPHIAW
ncbi:MAG: hypothetical protein J3K34DRAFT_525476 [Monoraphidium minutum]|nr:MAG: hypothetical protein J3K34DRAFT_525476 [Monoraphidium minutum]